MILKASQRGGSQSLAVHLLNPENEHVELHEVSGFVSENLTDAMREAYAISKGTRAKKFLFSLSLNPPESAEVSTEKFEQTLERIEKKLGIEGQPRCIVFHEKQGRRHCHCVWSRIDANEMKAIKLPYFKRKLNSIARELYLENQWDLPDGFKKGQNADPKSYNLKEWQQSRRHGKNPRDIKAAIQQAWEVSDGKASFKHALAESGYLLAQGDRRGFVAIDFHGGVYSLSRQLGIKTKEIKQRLGDPKDLPTVAVTKASLSHDLKILHKKLDRELKLKHQEELKPFKAQKNRLIKDQKVERLALKKQQQQRKITETKARQAKYRKGLSGIFDALLGRVKKLRLEHQRQTKAGLKRDMKEKDQLIAQHLAQRRTLQDRYKYLRSKQLKEDQGIQGAFTQTQQGSMTTTELTAQFNRDYKPKPQGKSQEQNNSPEISL